jgi:plastocyanin domain-containing protein
MTTFGILDWTVLVAGIAAIAWVNWYFFVAGGRARAVATTNPGGMQEVVIAVHGGYDPQTVQVTAGRPVRLVFDRQESAGCSEEVVFSDFGIRRFLPAFQKTAIEITPEKPGVYEYTCGMSMLRGKVVAEAAAGAHDEKLS